jgi:excisionase family DNA binding protein
VTTVINWTKDGSLKAYRTKGGHRRIKKNDLEEFLRKHKIPVSLKPKILIVDDEEAIRDGLKELFESLDYEVHVAGDGFSGGLLIEKNRPEVVILDLIMPGVDGFGVCERIREQEHLRHTKVIVLTGYPSQENIERAKKSGAARVLAKPVDNNVLVNEVNTLLGESR